MTVAQMCLAVRADKTWLFNAARILKKKIHRTPSGARWWGMVAMLNREIGVPLRRASQAADAILTEQVASNRIRIAATSDGGVALFVDLARFHSTANAALAAAQAFGTARSRGRPRKPTGDLEAQASDLDQPIEIRVRDNNAELASCAETLRGWNAYPRGIQGGLSFIMDTATIRAVSHLALTTDRGDVDVTLIRTR